MNRLNPWRVGSAMALTTGSISLVCASAVYLFPEEMIGFVNSWFHGLDLTFLKSDKPWTWADFSYGLFGATLVGFLSGSVFALFYNLVGYCPACGD